MPKTKPGLSVLLSVTYTLIVLAVLAIISLSVTAYLGKYFLSDRAEEQSQALRDCALDLIPYTEDQDPDYLYGILSSYAREQNGRILLLDTAGCVQVDTFCLLNGTHPQTAELQPVLSGKNDTAKGYHHLRLSDTAITKDNQYIGKAESSYWAAYYTQALVTSGNRVGVLLLVSPVQDIVDNVSSVARGLMLFSGVFILLVAGMTFYLSHSMTLSIRRFNRAIAKMSGGDLSVRVNENEIAEFGELARAFNSMAAQLENLDNARNQFVSDASHELKTPLASMKILSESLLTEPDAPAELYREFMGDINSEVDRLTLVINDLLMLAKSDRGPEALAMAPVALGDTIKKIINTVAPLAQKKHITLSYEYRDVDVLADELRMQQLFTNLIDNAIKYSKNDTTVTVTLTQTLSAAVVSVTDQGIGIGKEDLPHLFERFYRVDKARSRQAGGTGLGLAIVKQIVDQHAGTIEVKSEIGRGTTFVVTLPLAKEAEE